MKTKTAPAKTRYGWIRDALDQRDIPFAARPATTPAALPPSVALAPMPNVLDQGPIGSCTANMAVNLCHFDQHKQGSSLYNLSRLFVYYNTRIFHGTTGYDSGASIRNTIKAIARWGACGESLFPYAPSQFRKKPSVAAYTDGAKRQALTYSRILQDLIQMKTCLFEGHPFGFGFTVYPSFESRMVAKTGTVPMPALKEHPVGGHAVICCGYDDKTQRFMCQNSWSKNWGMKGFFTIPYLYLTSPILAADFWAVKTVEVG